MKRFALFALSILALTGCEDDPVVTQNAYPTDGLALSQVRNSLIMTSYLPMSGYTTQIPNLVLDDAYGENVHYMNVVNDPNNTFYSAIADSITFNQPLDAPPAFYLNDATVDLPSLAEAVATSLAKNPIASVNHKLTNTDSAWVIDSKVRFWKDTINSGFRIATYMLVNAKAANNPTTGINLTVNPAQGVILNNNDLSQWDTDIPNIDSTGSVASKGDIFYHQNVLVKNFNDESAWGSPFTDFSPFAQSFSRGDVIGTESTPIRHYFPKPDSDIEGAFTPDYEFSPSFITIIWCQNADTYKYEYINSVLTSMPLD